MHDPDVVVNPKVIYILDNSGYHNWTQDERRAVEAFLRDHDIDPADVPVANRSGSLIVRMLDGGALELDLWVYDRVDGHLVRCPTCPCCVRRKRLKCEVHSALPVVSTAWIYGVDTTEDETDTTEEEFDAAMADGEPVQVVGTYASGSVKTIDYRTTIPPGITWETP